MAVSRYGPVVCWALVLLLIVTRSSFATNGNHHHQFPRQVETTNTNPSTNSCRQMINQRHTREVVIRGRRTTVVETRLVAACCPGYSGENCNITNTATTNTSQPGQDQLDDPCRDLSCDRHPDAVCTVVTRCSAEIPVFLNREGEVVDCGNHRPLEDLRRTSCGKACPSDPCSGQTCAAFPTAVCLTTACDCKPIWLLASGVRVDCTSGEELIPQSRRTRRQTDSNNSPSSCTS